jgi:hypothetical protein
MDGGDWVAGFCLLLRLAEAAPPIPAAENSPETRGAGALRVPGATWAAGEVGEGAGEVPYLKANSGDPSMATETRRQPESTMADLGGCAENGGERGQRDSGRER